MSLKIGVIGAGGVGQTLGKRLLLAGQHVKYGALARGCPPCEVPAPPRVGASAPTQAIGSGYQSQHAHSVRARRRLTEHATSWGNRVAAPVEL